MTAPPDVAPRTLRTSAGVVRLWFLFALSPITVLVLPALRVTPPLVTSCVALLLPLGLVWRRPLAVLGLVLAETALLPLVPLHVAQPQLWLAMPILADLVVGVVAAALRPRLSIGCALVTLAVQLSVAGFVALWPGYLESYAARDVPALIIVWLLGNMIRTRRQYRQERRAQAEAQAVQAERLRIARELHDMVAHNIGGIAIQAGMGSRVIHTQPDQARNALRAIETTSRDTLSGLRSMIGALRETDSEPVVGQHGLRDLNDLVTRTRDAGVQVDLRRSGEQKALPPDIDLSAFRIVQEAVTNVIRHADTDRCQVTIDQTDTELRIDVTDNGRGGNAEPGYGLRGMRERITLLHGDFTATPRPEGGFRVTARIPLPAGTR